MGSSQRQTLQELSLCPFRLLHDVSRCCQGRTPQVQEYLPARRCFAGGDDSSQYNIEAQEYKMILDQSGVESLAVELAQDIRAGDRLYLTGPLGSGKSVFARAVLRELGVSGSIPSPSFIVDAVYYASGLEIHHIDLYRLEGDPAELEAYGIAEVLDSSSSVVLVEWADRLEADYLQGGI
ncbi:MAG: tRNA (adenosine(37)-N6)-threonylcarbamoyltransferase complex ATPase subunit type 1 TsaE, partial [Candidatus Aegiribacteria sp.]|nr:tRNA (adenosine(37)-N6)-threonylcarbamoyltransferase complex ATPase subunit type 1 TsaE [Candidatus Aegiribacteria sp.]MBD3294778.1 tRNA (adenosine(37)-N6)-threonylcarbamoyltransferase complex ATPase subunit type 1 TsaE [Candidatus Fermentibacteria bacterium]